MAEFLPILKTTFKVEAGYQALPNDTGNYNSKKELVGTNHGISAQTYEKWIGRPPLVADMKAITEDIAAAIYRKWYWNPIQGDALKSDSIAHFLFDFHVNSGTNAMKVMRGVLGLQKEGFPVTTPEVNLLNTMKDPAGFLEKYKDARVNFINSSTKISPNLKKGLINRIETVYDEVKKKFSNQSNSIKPESEASS